MVTPTPGTRVRARSTHADRGVVVDVGRVWVVCDEGDGVLRCWLPVELEPIPATDGAPTREGNRP